MMKPHVHFQWRKTRLDMEWDSAFSAIKLLVVVRRIPGCLAQTIHELTFG